jgi:hypothetical protein
MLLTPSQTLDLYDCIWPIILHNQQAFSQDPKRGHPILVQRYIYRKGGGGGFEKTFLWKTFEVYITSYQYLFQVRSKFFKHTWLCEY